MAATPWIVLADPRPAGHDGVLADVTVCVKDTIDVAGLPTRGGTTFPAEPAESDAAVVARLRDAGAVILGKGHTNEYAYGIDGVNEMIGAARNPFDPRRIAGGSSSGPALAAATGAAELGLGTDTSGSLRVPAALCGVVSLRPTHGALPLQGVMPLAPSFDVPGPVARDVDAVAASWEALTGAAAPTVAPATRTAGVLGSFVADVHPGVVDATAATVARLRALDVDVRDVDDDLVSRAHACHADIQLPEAAASITKLAPDHWRALPLALVERIEAGLAVPQANYDAAQEERALVRAEILDLLRVHDVLLGPAVPAPAPLIGDTTIELPSGPAPLRPALLARALPFSQAGVPVLTLPAGRVDGLPVAVQLAARPGGEHQLLELGRRLEAAP